MGWLLADDFGEDWDWTSFGNAMYGAGLAPYNRMMSGPPLTGLMFGTHEDWSDSYESAKQGPQWTEEEVAAYMLFSMVPLWGLATIGAWVADVLLWRHPVVAAVSLPLASANIMYEMGMKLDQTSPSKPHTRTFMNVYSESGTMSGALMPTLPSDWISQKPSFSDWWSRVF